jgi:hypothetical protein
VKNEKPIFIVENLESNDEHGGGKMLKYPDRGNFLLGGELTSEMMHSNGSNSRS